MYFGNAGDSGYVLGDDLTVFDVSGIEFTKLLMSQDVTSSDSMNL